MALAIILGLATAALAFTLSQHRRAQQRQLYHLYQTIRQLDDQAAPERSASNERLARNIDHGLTALRHRLHAAERRRAEQDAVLGAMRDGVMAISAGGQVLLLNPAARRLFGITHSNFSGRPVTEVVRHPDLLRILRRLKEEGRPLEAEIALDREGVQRRLMVNASPIANPSSLQDGERERPGGALLVLADITRIRELEAMRRDFAANVSHELKTPITAIKGAVETLQHGAADDPEARHRFIDILGRHALRLERLVNDTLSLSRIEREVERGELPLIAAPLQPVLEAAQGAVESRAQARGVRISVDCPATLRAAIDADMLEQALSNLINNAVAYGPEGGTVSVSARLTGEGVAIAVADQGPGIDPAHHDRLFERFYRVDSGRGRAEGGTGLGLAIVKHIAGLHGGSVRVDSRPGHGSTFSLLLPAL